MCLDTIHIDYKPTSHYFILVKVCCRGWSLMTSSAAAAQGQILSFLTSFCEWLLVGLIWGSLVSHGSPRQNANYAFLGLFGTVRFFRIEHVISQHRQVTLCLGGVHMFLLRGIL